MILRSFSTEFRLPRSILLLAEGTYRLVWTGNRRAAWIFTSPLEGEVKAATAPRHHDSVSGSLLASRFHRIACTPIIEQNAENLIHAACRPPNHPHLHRAQPAGLPAGGCVECTG